MSFGVYITNHLLRCFQLFVLSRRTSSSLSAHDNLPKKKCPGLLEYFSFFSTKDLLSLLSLFFFHKTWYPIFSALDKSFCKVLLKCIQMMGNIGVLYHWWEMNRVWLSRDCETSALWSSCAARMQNKSFGIIGASHAHETHLRKSL